MPTHVQSPDGDIIQFPDSMGDDQINDAMKGMYPPANPYTQRTDAPAPLTPFATTPYVNDLGDRVGVAAQQQMLKARVAAKNTQSPIDNTHWQSSGARSANMASPMRPGTSEDQLEQMASQDEANQTRAAGIDRSGYGPDFSVSRQSYFDKAGSAEFHLKNALTTRGLPNEGAQNMLLGPILGPTEFTAGASMIPDHPVRGVNQMIGGAMHTAELPLAIAAPEMMLKYAIPGMGIQAGLQKLGEKAGLDPDINELGSTLLSLGVMGGVGGAGAIRERLASGLMDNLRAQGGVPEHLIEPIARDMVRKYEASGDAKYLLADNVTSPGAGKAIDLATQRVAAGLQQGAASITMRPHDQNSIEAPPIDTPLAPSTTERFTGGFAPKPWEKKEIGIPSAQTITRPETAPTSAIEKSVSTPETPKTPETEAALNQGDITPSGQGLLPEQKFASAAEAGPRIPGPDDPERGSLSFRKRKPIYSDSALGRLTQHVDEDIQDAPVKGDRLSVAEYISSKYGDTADSFRNGLGKLGSHSVALMDKWARPAPFTDFTGAVGEFSGDLQRNAIDSTKFVQRVMKDVPSKARREAITNYIQAKGDHAELARRSSLTQDPRLKRGYDLAQTLTPDEIKVAGDIRSYFDSQLDVAQKMGVLADGLENYVPQAWKKPGDMTKLAADIYNAKLKPNAPFMRKRFFDHYFEGEQAGFTPRSKDIGYLVGAYNQSFNQAIASRAFISKLTTGLASDGRPLVAAPQVSGKTIPAPGLGDTETHFIAIRSTPEEVLNGYEPINHPALKGWNWAAQGELGDNIFMKGQLWVHPEIYDKLDTLFRTSSFRRSPLGNAVLKGSSLMKGTLLSFSPFHQIQEGRHALMHRVNPFSPPELNVNDPKLSKLLDRGLILGDDTGMQQFSEGLHGAGVWKYVPGFSQMSNMYSNYLFAPGGYISRLKASMATSAIDRNMRRYGGDIKAGKITEDQVYKLTAEQSNAAFGELNYKMLGRSPTTQDAFRLLALAPDFLEARARFVGQAMKPYGREQQAALFRGAGLTWVTARVVNMLLDPDHDPHYETPFSIVGGGREYSMRGVPEDVWHLMTDYKSFLYHRLNPATVRPAMEGLYGKDIYGRRRDIGDQAKDYFKNLVPIAAQSNFSKLVEKGYNESSFWDSVRESGGIRSVKYRTPAENLARTTVLDSMSPNAQSRGITYLATKIQEGRYDPAEAEAMVNAGRITPKDILNALKMAKKPELLRNFDNENVHTLDAAKIYLLAKPKERAMLQKSFTNKMLNMNKLPRQEQERIQPILDSINQTEENQK